MFAIAWRETGRAELVWTGEELIESSLLASIVKWEHIVAFYKEFPNRLIEGGGRYTCALCVEYNGDCRHCPVMIATGHSACYNTPYDLYTEALDNDDPEDAYMAAKLELEFLRSLLPG